MSRAVITGYGVAPPIGNDADSFLNSLKEGTDDITSITRFDASETGITLAGEARDFPYDKYFVKRGSKRMDMSSIYGIYAALEAMEMSGLDKEKMNQDRLGVIIGSGIGGLPAIENQIIRLHERDIKRASPMLVPVAIANMAAGNITLRVGAKGICTAIVTAYASGTNSIGEAFRNIKHGYSDVILAGGAETAIYEMEITGFAALVAFSESTDPNRDSIPSDENRSSFVMGEGADVLVLKSLGYAQARGAKIYGEIVGYGADYDVYYMTTPTPDGPDASKAVKLAMGGAGVQPEQVGYINAHGTSAPANDRAETKTIRIALGENSRDTYVSSTKSMTGHLLGTTGRIEALATLLALGRQFISPTINVEKQDPEIGLTAVKNESKLASFTYTMSDSLGFGGHNAVLYIKR